MKTSIKDIRKEPYQNWNHFKYEDYNDCPFCGGKIRMIGQISENQKFICMDCGKEFTLNAFTEEIKEC